METTIPTPAPKKKKSWASFIIIVLICGSLYYMYSKYQQVKVVDAVKSDTTVVTEPTIDIPIAVIDTTKK